MVLAFAGAGADVVIASRKLDNCQALADEVSASSDRRALPVACHVGHWEDCDALADRVQVNTLSAGPFLTDRRSTWRRPPRATRPAR